MCINLDMFMVIFLFTLYTEVNTHTHNIFNILQYYDLFLYTSVFSFSLQHMTTCHQKMFLFYS